jgi:hypothetical protein
MHCSTSCIPAVVRGDDKNKTGVSVIAEALLASAGRGVQARFIVIDSSAVEAHLHSLSIRNIN